MCIAGLKRSWQQREADKLWLVLLTLAVVGSNLLWAARDTFPMGDSATQLLNALGYYRTAHLPLTLPQKAHRLLLWQPQRDSMSIDVDLLNYRAFPPLLYAVTALTFTVGGCSRAAAMLAVQMFVPLMLFSGFALGRHYGGRVGGWMLVGLMLGSPILTLYSRMYYPDVPLAALAAAAYWCLVSSDGLSRRAGAVWCGVLGGLGLLISWSFALVFLPPVLYVAVARRQPQQRVNLCLALATALLVAAPWYLASQARFGGGLSAEWSLSDSVPELLLRLLAICALHPLLPLMAAYGVVQAWRDRHTHMPTLTAAAIGGPLLALVVPHLRLLHQGKYPPAGWGSDLASFNHRCILPLAPFAFILCSFWVSRASSRMQRWIGGCVLLIAVAQNLSWMLPLPPLLSVVLARPPIQQDDLVAGFMDDLTDLARRSANERESPRRFPVFISTTMDRWDTEPISLGLQAMADFGDRPLRFVNASGFGLGQQTAGIERLLKRREPLFVLARVGALKRHDREAITVSQWRENWEKNLQPYRLRLLDEQQYRYGSAIVHVWRSRRDSTAAESGGVCSQLASVPGLAQFGAARSRIEGIIHDAPQL